MEEGRIEEICLPFLDAALAFNRIILTILSIVNTDMSHCTSLEPSLTL